MTLLEEEPSSSTPSTRPSVEDIRARRGGIDVVGGMTKDELEQFLNDVNDWEEKLNEKGGKFFDKFAFQVDQFQKTMWDNGGNIINDQLGQVNKEKGNGETKIHSVISFNIYYKEEFLIKMLEKLIKEGNFDVICLQEMCGPWLVANKTVKFDAAKKNGATWDSHGQNICGRMLENEELSKMIDIIDSEAPTAPAPAPAAEPAPTSSSSNPSSEFRIKPSRVRVNEHLAGWIHPRFGAQRLNWHRTIQDLTEYIDDQDRKATLNKGLDVEDIIGGGGLGSTFNSVKWAKWWLDYFTTYTIVPTGGTEPGYVTADFKEDSELKDYSIIFAPANHTNGFYLCSFGNAIIYKKNQRKVEDVPIIKHSDAPVPTSKSGFADDDHYGPVEGRNALKVKIDDINYICMHLDEKSFWKSQVVMLNKWIEERLFDEECIVCGDMNVMDVTINPIKTLLLEGHRDYSIAGDAKLNDEVKGEGQVGEGNKHSDRSKILWNLFAQDQTNKKKLTSIYEKVGGGTHIRTVANGGGVDYVGYSPAYEGIQTGVIYPVLPEDELQEQEKDDVVKRMGGWPPSRLFPTWRGYCISDHWLPFLVFKTIKKTPQTQTQPPPPSETETAGAEADTPIGDGQA
uniref:Endonuclease/exonuclease/phosphatase domain-containing protein n=1 Tax=viral metagenome TaxID=1070528 RepID=A0A6C0FB85_9ZZZZ